jgi:uncharacterized protein (DUF58 family)
VAAVPSGLVVSDAMAVVLAAVAGLGVVADRPLLTAVGACVLMLALLARLWTRHALEGVHYAISASPARAVAGDDVDLIVTLENHKRLPVPWLRVQEPLPPGLVLADAAGQVRGTFGTGWLTATTTLGGRERVRLHYRLRSVSRGHYVLGPGRVTAGDLFGLYLTERVQVRGDATLTVIPRIPATGPGVLSPARPLGERRSRRRGADDPQRPLTVREYRPGDPARRIDWKVTARRGAPWVRVNEPGAGGTVALLVECDTRERGVFDHSAARLEAVVCAAAAAARDLLREGYAVGLVADGVPPGDRSRVAVAPGAGPAQLNLLLDALARVQPLVPRPLADLVQVHAARLLPAGASVVCVAAALPEATAACLAARARRGLRVDLVWLGREAPATIPGVRTVTWVPDEEATT